MTDTPLAPTTTTQEDLTTASQRRVNLIWEFTQSFVTVSVVLANMIVAVWNGIAGGQGAEHPVVLTSALFMILGAYFQRTNHQRIGGIGSKATDWQKYEGR